MSAIKTINDVVPCSLWRRIHCGYTAEVICVATLQSTNDPCVVYNTLLDGVSKKLITHISDFLKDFDPIFIPSHYKKDKEDAQKEDVAATPSSSKENS